MKVWKKVQCVKAGATVLLCKKWLECSLCLSYGNFVKMFLLTLEF